jgi:ferric-dicitrate binding protein FerR (iron transport regulator)
MSQQTDRSLEKLLKLAGQPDMPSSDATERARNRARQSWERMLNQERVQGTPRRRSRFTWALAAAAGLAVVAVLLIATRAPPVAVRVANVLAADEGAVLHARKDSVVRPLTEVHSGATLATGGARVALTFGDSLSLRVDRHTQLRFDGADHVTLLAGSVYVDSGGINAVPRLSIETPAGEVRHVGTQFQVSVSGTVTRVRVREGRVLLTPQDAAAFDMAAGDELEIAGTRAQWRHGLASYGAGWEWATAVGPTFAAENRPLAEFLTWLAREHGWQLRYAGDSMQQRTHEIRLHGSLEGLDADAMIERVSLITGIPLSARDGVLWIGASAARP